MTIEAKCRFCGTLIKVDKSYMADKYYVEGVGLSAEKMREDEWAHLGSLLITHLFLTHNTRVTMKDVNDYLEGL